MSLILLASLMKPVLLIVLFLSASLDAKIIHLFLQVRLTEPWNFVRDQFTIDKELPVWKFRNYLFHEYGLDDSYYALVEDTVEGKQILDLHHNVGKYGPSADAPMIMR